MAIEHPACFGHLDQVFPMGADGLRAVSAECQDCQYSQPCLREALNTKEGARMRAERLESMNQHFGKGPLGFLRRWSELKALRKIEEKKS
ncbi:MAG: hypothetical protein HQK55_12735 [Deltaproteobacteria bacterium]|nr:hypothetical protein [Deltaproteobacteria bacterium]